MSTTQAQYDVLLTQLGTAESTETSTIIGGLKTIGDAIAKLAAVIPPGNVDLTNEAVAAQSLIADMQTQTEALSDSLAKLAVATTPPTPPAAS